MYLIVPLLARLDFLGVCGKMWEEVVGSGIFTKRCTGKVVICVILASYLCYIGYLNINPQSQSQNFYEKFLANIDLNAYRRYSLLISPIFICTYLQCTFTDIPYIHNCVYDWVLVNARCVIICK